MRTLSRFGILAFIVLWAALTPVVAQVAPPLPSALTTIEGGTLGPYTPPPCVAGVPFSDITCSTGYDPWIEQFARDGITAGCGGGLYCPNSPVTRDQMAVFIEAGMRGTANWPPHTQIVWAMKAADGSPDPIASGTGLLDAVQAIPTSGNDVPSSVNHWLVKVGPGVFNLNGSGLYLPPYVDLDGAGQDTTTITSNNNMWYVVNTGAGANRVSNLTLTNFNSGSYTYVVLAQGTGLTLDHVFIEGLSGTIYTIGIYSQNSALYIYDGAIVAAGGNGFGIYTNGGQYHAAQVWRTLFSCGTADVYNAAGQEIDLANTRVPDPLSNFTTGVFRCIGNYNFLLAPVTCP